MDHWINLFSSAAAINHLCFLRLLLTRFNISILAKPPEKIKNLFAKGAFIQVRSHLIIFRAKDNKGAKWIPARSSWFSCAIVRPSSSYISLRPNLVAFLREMVRVVLILPYLIICDMLALLNNCDYVMSIRHTSSRCPRMFSVNPLLRGLWSLKITYN